MLFFFRFSILLPDILNRQCLVTAVFYVINASKYDDIERNIPASGMILKMQFSDIMSLTMKATVPECVSYKFFANLYKYKQSANKCKIFCLLRK